MIETSKTSAQRLHFSIISAPTINEIYQSLTEGDEYQRRSVCYMIALMLETQNESGGTLLRVDPLGVPIEVEVIVDSINRIHEKTKTGSNIDYWELSGRIIKEDLWGFKDFDCFQYITNGAGQFDAYDSFREVFGQKSSNDVNDL